MWSYYGLHQLNRCYWPGLYLCACLFQGYIRIAKCSLALGDLSAADNALSIVKELNPNNAAIIPEVQKLEVVRRFDEEASKAYQKQDYRKVTMFCEIFV